MTTFNQKREMALSYIREHKESVQVLLWCGYANVIPFCYSRNNDFKQSELLSIGSDNKIKFVVDYYFDNGYISEYNVVYASNIKDAVSKGYNLNILKSLRSNING